MKPTEPRPTPCECRMFGGAPHRHLDGAGRYAPRRDEAVLCAECGHGEANHERTPTNLAMMVLCRSCPPNVAWHDFKGNR